ncbi:putative reverse transcriptase domain-containing protein [Tanacetum coccineum]
MLQPQPRVEVMLGHEEKDCRVRFPDAGGNALQNMTYFGCEEKGHYKNRCPKGRNPPNEGARTRAYVVVENPQQNPNAADLEIRMQRDKYGM